MGCEDSMLIEKLHRKFCKILLGVNNGTYFHGLWRTWAISTIYNIKINSRLLNLGANY